MGGDARAAIIAEADKRGMKPFLPPAVPFGSQSVADPDHARTGAHVARRPAVTVLPASLGSPIARQSGLPAG